MKSSDFGGFFMNFFSLACFKNKLIAENLIDLYMWKSSRDF